MAQPTKQVVPMYQGEPQCVKLCSGETIIAVLYREVDDIEDQLAVWLDKPLKIHQLKKNDHGKLVVFMERWMPVSIEHMFQIAQSDVLVVGELSDDTIADYLIESGRLYGSISADQPAPTNDEERRQQLDQEIMFRQFEHMPVRDIQH